MKTIKKTLIFGFVLLVALFFVSCKTDSRKVVSLALEETLVEYQSGDSATHVTQDVTLKTSVVVKDGKKDVEVAVSYVSSLPQTLAVSGTSGHVVRDLYEDQAVNLTVTATYKGASASTEISLNVVSYDLYTAALSNVSIIYVAEETSQSVVHNVKLPRSASVSHEGTSYSFDVEWSTSDATVITASGVVHQDPYVDKAVTLTASVGGRTRAYSLVVLTSDAPNTAYDNLSPSYAAGDSAGHVTQDLGLPTSVTAGGVNFPVSWSSSNTSVVTTSGVVTRDLFSDVEVVLTATIDGRQKSFVVTVVKADDPVYGTVYEDFPYNEISILLGSSAFDIVEVYGTSYTIDINPLVSNVPNMYVNIYGNPDADFVATYGQELEAAGFTYLPDYDLYLSPDELYVVGFGSDLSASNESYYYLIVVNAEYLFPTIPDPINAFPVAEVNELFG